MGQRYAVLISSSSGPFYAEFYFDVVNMRQSLLNHGFAANNIYVLYGNGNDYTSAAYPAAKYNPTPDITDMSATITNIQQIFTDLSAGSNGFPQVTNQDMLFVYTFDHGNDEEPVGSPISVLCLNDGNMRADDFATAVDQVDCAYRIFCMQQCFSGGFIPHLTNDRTVILTAADDDEIALPADTESEIIADPVLGNVFYPHGEFNWHLFAALDGQTLDGTAVNADANANTFLTMREVFDYIAGIESRPETPQYDDGDRDMGERLHLSFADLCMRDNLSDTGIEPTASGGLSRSPDICHFRNQLLDPVATLLSPSALNNDTLFENVEEGQSNWIYLRVRNRGYTASDANVDLYWTRPSTLPTPASWNFIGTVPVPLTQPDQWVVAGPLEWPSDQLPDTKHCCFIALLSNAQDPAPDLNSVTNSASFTQLIRENNNVTWKNFDVDNLFGGGYANVEFQVQGWPRVSSVSDLELDLSALPPGVNADLKIVKRITESANPENMNQDHESTLFVQYKLDCNGICALRQMNLNPSDNTKATLTIQIPEDAVDGVYDVWVRQVIDNHEVGRITRRIAIGDHPYVGNRNTRELHIRGKCIWEKMMSGKNRVAFSDPDTAVNKGYNGCAYCMPEINTD